MHIYLIRTVSTTIYIWSTNGSDPTINIYIYICGVLLGQTQQLNDIHVYTWNTIGSDPTTNSHIISMKIVEYNSVRPNSILHNQI